MPKETYRPWIDKSRQSHLTDHEVLRSLADSEGPKTPFGIAGRRGRVSTTRVQCHYMDRLGYLTQTAIDTYDITSAGKTALRSNKFESYINIEQELKLDYDHITDLGELLQADTIIAINKQFYEGDVPYESEGITLRDIESVRDARLERLTTEFPRFEPLTNQLAHAVRTFCGHHLFPDANHRTGTHIADQLAQRQGDDLFELIKEDINGITRAVYISKILRGLCSDVRKSVDQLWIKDELFYHWNRYFRDLLYEVSPKKRVHLTTGQCQYKELVSNEEVEYILRFARLSTEEMREIVKKRQDG